MKHKNNKLVVTMLIVASIAVVWAMVNTILLSSLYRTQNTSDINNILATGRINNLIDCAHGDKNVCNAIPKLAPSGKSDGLFKQD